MDKKIWPLQGEDFDNVQAATDEFKAGNTELRAKFEAEQKKLAEAYWRKVFPVVGLDFDAEQKELLTVDTEHVDYGVLIIKNHPQLEETAGNADESTTH